MASSVSGEFERIMAEAMDEIDKKIEKAFNRTMKRVEKELQELMDRETFINFYEGYMPVIYVRTNQLKDAVSFSVEDRSNADNFSFKVNPFYDETTMDHSTYKVHTTYQPRKNKKAYGPRKIYKKTTTVRLKTKPDEEKIMEMTLGEGYHPSVGTAGTRAPIWTQEDEGVFIDGMIKYLQDNVQVIFNEEYSRL